MKFEHMNAKKADNTEQLFADIHYIAERKHDGVRFIYENGHLWTRNGHDKALWLPSIMRHLQAVDAVLDMEVYIEHGTSKDMQSFIGTKAPTGQDERCTFAVFDLLEYENVDWTKAPWNERRSMLETIAYNYLLPITEVWKSDFESHYADVLRDDGEGLMLKNVNASYQCGKRPANTWYKVKKHDTADVIITGYLPGTGKNAHMVGSITFSDETDRSGSCSGLTDEDRKFFTALQNRLIGRTIEISYMEKTEKAYRHPVFVCLREDK